MPHKCYYCFWNPYEHLCTSNNCISFIGSELVPGLVFLREGEAGGTVRVGLSSVLQRFGKARRCRPEPLKLAHELPEDAVKMQFLIL